MRGITWTDDRVERLKTLYNTGISCSQIAAEMKCGITRNAVIGKLSRLGLSRDRRQAPRLSLEERQARQSNRWERWNEHRRVLRQQFRAENPKAARPVVCEEVTPRHLTLLQLESADCRYPYGDSNFTFCGNHAPSGSYCPYHASIVVGRGTESERTAHKVTPKHMEAAA